MCSNPIVLQRTHKREESVKNISSLQMMEFDKKEGRASFTNVSSRKPSFDIKNMTGFIKEAQCQFVTDSCEQEYFYSWPCAIYISVELSAEEY